MPIARAIERPLDRLRRSTRCSPHGAPDFPLLRILAAENLRHNREYQEYLLSLPDGPNFTVACRAVRWPLRGPFTSLFAFPMREQNPMQTRPLPDISVDFMTWLNTELRKRIDADDDSETRGLVNRLKNYFGRPVPVETVGSEF